MTHAWAGPTSVNRGVSGNDGGKRRIRWSAVLAFVCIILTWLVRGPFQARVLEFLRMDGCIIATSRSAKSRKPPESNSASRNRRCGRLMPFCCELYAKKKRPLLPRPPSLLYCIRLPEHLQLLDAFCLRLASKMPFHRASKVLCQVRFSVGLVFQDTFRIGQAGACERVIHQLREPPVQSHTKPAAMSVQLARNAGCC